MFGLSAGTRDPERMREALFFLLSSFWAGAAHAATPGDGKTIAAAHNARAAITHQEAAREHALAGKKPRLVHLQLRPDPLAHSPRPPRSGVAERPRIGLRAKPGLSRDRGPPERRLARGRTTSGAAVLAAPQPCAQGAGPHGKCSAPFKVVAHSPVLARGEAQDHVWPCGTHTDAAPCRATTFGQPSGQLSIAGAETTD